MKYWGIGDWIAGGIVVVGLVGFYWGLAMDLAKDKEMKTIPYEMTPVSTVKCHNRYGTLVYENKITEKGVTHVLTRLPCMVYYGLGCCVSDPPKDSTEDGRRWGVGRTDTDLVIDIDGRNIECVIIKGVLQ
jgi:hypothetical protein